MSWYLRHQEALCTVSAVITPRRSGNRRGERGLGTYYAEKYPFRLVSAIAAPRIITFGLGCRVAEKQRIYRVSVVIAPRNRALSLGLCCVEKVQEHYMSRLLYRESLSLVSVVIAPRIDSLLHISACCGAEKSTVSGRPGYRCARKHLQSLSRPSLHRETLEVAVSVVVGPRTAFMSWPLLHQEAPIIGCLGSVSARY